MAQYPNATTENIKQWAYDALDEASGCAFWEFPPTANVCIRFILTYDLLNSLYAPKPRGSLLSSYVLATFAPLLKMIANSHFHEQKPPIGASRSHIGGGTCLAVLMFILMLMDS